MLHRKRFGTAGLVCLGILSLLSESPAPAQQQPQRKKPVTLDAIAGEGGSVVAPQIAGIVWRPDGKAFAYTQAGRVHLYDVTTRTSRELFRMQDMSGLSSAGPAPATAPARFDWENRRVREQTLQWTPDGRALVVARDGDLFLFRVQSPGGFVPLIQTPGIAERDPQLSPDGTRVAFRRDHDLYVLDIASGKQTRLTATGSPTLLNGELDWVYPEELSASTAFWWSPDSSQIAYLQFDVSRVPLYPHADFLKPAATAEPQRYPQTGAPNSTIRLGTVPARGGETRWMDLGDTESRYIVARVAWMRNSKALLVQRLNRIQNQLDLLRFDTATGEPSRLLRETDPWWVNVQDDMRLLKDGERFLWSTERDSGFRHLSLRSLTPSAIPDVSLTKGEWEIRAVAGVDEAAGAVYYTSSEASPVETQLYSVKFDGTGKKRLSTAPGIHKISMSPDSRYYVDISTSLERPWKQTLHQASDGSEVAVIAEASRRQTDEYEILPTEIVKLKAADGTTDLFAKMIRPAGFQTGRKYPAVVEVYGGPHAQSVTNTWQGLTFGQVLAHKGFVVLQVDNRGTSGRGHAFEATVFRKLGVTELADQKAALKQIIDMGFVDPARVGVTGWSYGGFMTLNLMLNAPEMYRAGLAGAPVTNFRNYDSIYTERYMGLPSENADGYALTDMTKSAKNLKGRLMLMCNIEDDNVLFQNMLQMTNALQQAGKLFDFMLYPQKAHGVTGPARKHMQQTMLAFFERELLTGH